MQNATELLIAHQAHVAKIEARKTRQLTNVIKAAARDGYYCSAIWCDLPESMLEGVERVPGEDLHLDWSKSVEFSQIADAFWDRWFRKHAPLVERELIGYRHSTFSGELKNAAVKQLKVFLARKGLTVEVMQFDTSAVFNVSL